MINVLDDPRVVDIFKPGDRFICSESQASKFGSLVNKEHCTVACPTDQGLETRRDMMICTVKGQESEKKGIWRSRGEALFDLMAPGQGWIFTTGEYTNTDTAKGIASNIYRSRKGRTRRFAAVIINKDTDELLMGYYIERNGDNG